MIQISTATYKSRDGAPLGRSNYVELELGRGKAQGKSIKLSPSQKPCEKMTDAIVTDGGKRGQIVKVCADRSCRIHYEKQPSALEIARTRAEERKRMEKQKLAFTIRHRLLAEILKRVNTPLKRGDLLTVAEYAILSLPFNQEARMAKRHKLEEDNGHAAGTEKLLKLAATKNESELSRLLVEISLLDWAYQLPANEADDALLSAARRYRIDVDKVQKAVTKEFATKNAKRTAKQTSREKKATITAA